MTDVFISYKREEREQARLLAEALSAEGFSVWWDAEILPGEQYRSVTLEILESCHAALVIWSQKSVSSNWVLDEAQRALDRGVLIPVMFQRLEHYPLGFGQVHAHDLTAWQGGAKEAPFKPVVAAVRRLSGRHEVAEPEPEPQRSSAEVETEVAFWRGVHDSNDVADLETYLARYRDGLFADLARRRIETLLQSAPPKRKRAAKSKREARAEEEPAQAKPMPLAALTPEPEESAAVDAPTEEPAAVNAQPETPEPAEPLHPVEPGPEPAWRMYSRWDLAFIALVALLSPFLLWLPVNLLLVHGDNKDLFGISNFPDVILLSPILIGLAWVYDRLAAWFATLESMPARNAPRIGVGAALVLALIVAFIADSDARPDRVHLVLWAAAVWAAAIFARQAVAWLRANIPEFDRLVAGRS